MAERNNTFASWKKDVPVFGLFAILSAIMTFPLVTRMADTIENWGDPLLNAWILSWDIHQLLTNPLHLYDANIFYPYGNTLAFSESLLASALLVAPVNLFTGNAILAYNVLVYLSFVLSGFTGYLLGRELTGSRTAGLVGGFVYAFSMYRFGEFSHVQLLTAQWIPLALLYLSRFLRDATLRSGLLFALFFSLQALSSFYYAFYVAIASGLYALFVAFPWIMRRSPAPPPLLKRALIVLGIIAFVVVPQSIPYFVVQRELGLYRTLEDTVSGSAALENYVSVPLNSPYAQIDAPFFSGALTEETLFPGIIPLFLAILALVAGRKNRLQVGFYATLVAVAFVLSLGPFLKVVIEEKPELWLPLPYGFLYEYLPGFKAMRVPARFAVLILLGLSSLAALGTDRIIGRWRTGARLLTVSILGLLILGESYSVPVRATPIDVGNQIPEVYRWLAGQKSDGAVFEYPTMESTFPPLVEEMERLGRYQYLSTYHWWPTVNGYSGFIPPLFAAVKEEARNFPSATSVSLLRGLGTRYVIFHTAEIEPGKWVEIQKRLASMPADLQPVKSFGTDLVYRLIPGRSNGSVQLDVYLAPALDADGEYRGYLQVLNKGNTAAIYKVRKELDLKVRWEDSGRVILAGNERIELPAVYPAGMTVVPFVLKSPELGRYQLSVEVNEKELLAKAVTSVEIKSPEIVAASSGQPELKESLQVMEITTERSNYQPGDVVSVRVKWRAPSSIVRNYTLFAKLVDGNYRAVAGVEAEPLQGFYKTSHWQPESSVDDLYGIIVPPGLPSGRYKVMVGAYSLLDGMEPQLLDPNGEKVERIIVGSVRIAGNDGRLLPDVKPEMQSAGGNLGGLVGLRGYNVGQPTLRPGNTLNLTLYWEALKYMDDDYTAFVHVLDSAGRPVAQIDGQPTGGKFPTSIWEPGELIPDERKLALPSNLPPGKYQIKAGMYLLPGPKSLYVQEKREKDDEVRLYLGEVEIAR